jgi:hypothetical protein
MVEPCEFGYPRDDGARTFALIGDSHAMNWRTTLQVVGDAKRWHGVSLTRGGCPMSTAVRNRPEPARSQCRTWQREVVEWLGGHPEVSTVFVAQLAAGSGVIPSLGQDAFAAAVEGYIDAWKAMPPTVQHIVVIRDAPRIFSDTGRCIERAVAARRNAGISCANRRRSALIRDPAVVAARRLRSPRVQVVDMTRFFCDRRTCYPVIGGALVNKDVTHLSLVFATTLGPYLLREVDRLSASW